MLESILDVKEKGIEDICVKCLVSNATISAHPCGHNICCDSKVCLEYVQDEPFCLACKLPVSELRRGSKVIYSDTYAKKISHYLIHTFVFMSISPFAVLFISFLYDRNTFLNVTRDFIGHVAGYSSIYILGMYLSLCVFFFQHFIFKMLQKSESVLWKWRNYLKAFLIFLGLILCNIFPNYIMSVNRATFIMMVLLQFEIEMCVLLADRFFYVIKVALLLGCSILFYENIDQTIKFLFVGVFMPPQLLPMIKHII